MCDVTGSRAGECARGWPPRLRPGPAPGHREVPGRLARCCETGRPDSVLPAGSAVSLCGAQGRRFGRGPVAGRRGREGSRVCFVAVGGASLGASPVGPGRGGGIPAVTRLRERAPLVARSPQRPPLPVLCAHEPGPGAVRGPDVAGRRKGTVLPALRRGPPPGRPPAWAGAGCSVSPSAVSPSAPPFRRALKAPAEVPTWSLRHLAYLWPPRGVSGRGREARTPAPSAPGPEVLGMLSSGGCHQLVPGQWVCLAPVGPMMA